MCIELFCGQNTVWTQILPSISIIFFKHQNQPEPNDEWLGRYDQIDPQLNIKRCGSEYFYLYDRFKLSTNVYPALGTVVQAHGTNITVEQIHAWYKQLMMKQAHGTNTPMEQ